MAMKRVNPPGVGKSAGDRVNLDALDDFSSAAEKRPPGPASGRSKPSAQKSVVRPWEEPGVRDDVVKQFQLRMSEPDKLKLQWLKEEGLIKSEHAFILEVVKAAIEKAIKGAP